jgi:hypothetical protein
MGFIDCDHMIEKLPGGSFQPIAPQSRSARATVRWCAST